MKIKRYNDYVKENFSILYDINKIEELLNDEKFRNIVEKICNGLPEFFKNKISKYFENNIIDIDKIKNFIEKYNVFEKVKKLYDNGVTNIKDIYDKLFPKKEAIGEFIIAVSIFSILFSLVLLLHNLSLYNNKYKYGFSLMLIASLVLLIYGANITIKNNKRVEKESKIINVEIKNEGKIDTLYLRVLDNGKYEIIKKK